jgi:hypothetical protein
MRIKNQKDFIAGILFIAFGGFFSGIGAQYKFGSAANMGPGYFPTVLGILLMLLGAIVMLVAMSSKTKVGNIEQVAWAANFWVLVPIVLFGILLKPLGLVIPLLGLVVATSYASHDFRWKSALINAIVLLILCLGIFIYGLNLQFQLWPSFIVKY